MKSTTKFVLALVATSSAAFAHAQAAPESSLAFNVGAVSEYRYRGLGQTKGDPALQGGVDYTDKSGLYVGAWASTIKWIKEAGIASGVSTKGPLELDLYGGYKFEAAGLGFDVGYLRYEYVNNTLSKISGSANANTDELYGAATYGPITLKYSQAISNLFGFANSKNSTYVDLSATFDLGGGYTLTPHIGRQAIKGENKPYSYTDHSVTLTKDFGGGLSGTLAAVGTNAKPSLYTVNGYNQGKDTVVVGIKYTF